MLQHSTSCKLFIQCVVLSASVLSAAWRRGSLNAENVNYKRTKDDGLLFIRGPVNLPLQRNIKFGPC